MIDSGYSDTEHIPEWGTTKEQSNFVYPSNKVELTDEEKKQQAKRKLHENQKKIKQLQQENILLCSQQKKPGEEGKQQKLQKLVSIAHKGALEYEGTDLVGSIKQSILNIDELDYFIDHGTDRFYRSGVVLKEYEDHPVQKKLIREKLLSRVEVKNSGTAFKHIKTILSAKSDYATKNEVQQLRKEIEAVRNELRAEREALQSVQAVQAAQGTVVSTLADALLVTRQNLNQITTQVTTTRKAQFLMLYNENKYSMSEISKILGVSRPTLYKWVKQHEATL